ncbi:MAG TPA: serine hydrolase domain-containing protein [Gemmatimonadaceae bacterium]|nr:serine hydrolase domain-containing protein [Gemmatimonadaceae bacterium]
MLAAIVCAGAPAAAQNAVPDSALRQIDAVFSRYTPETPGCALGVFENGRIVLEKGYGSANIEYGVPFTPTTPTIMGSVSKQFTAAAIALLAEQGRISLDDDVRKYVPELPDYGKRVTIDELVHHTSGIRDFWALVEAAGMRFDDGYSVGDVLSLAARQRHLNFDPGTEYAYSNTGYVLLGVIVQRVTGKSLREFANEQIFQPLGMRASHYHDDHNQPVRGRASAYSPVAGGGWRINVWNNDIVGQGGLMTTVEDLQKWDENFYTGRVGGASFLARQLTRGRLSSGKELAYAFGLEIGEYRGLPMVEHAGSTGGYRTVITRFPAQHTTLVALCNVSSADAPGMAHRVADVLLAGTFTKPAPTPLARQAAQKTAATVPLTPSELSALAGSYYSDELDATYELTVSGSNLLVRRPRAPVDTLQASGRRTVRGSGYTLRFAAASPGGGGSPSFTFDNDRARGIEFVRRPSR